MIAPHTLPPWWGVGPLEPPAFGDGVVGLIEGIDAIDDSPGDGDEAAPVAALQADSAIAVAAITLALRACPRIARTSPKITG